MDQVFLTINSWMGQGLLLGGVGCFLWGMVSVLFSPCHLASIPLIVSVQATMFSGVMSILLFAIGHCIPIVVAGSSTAMVKRLLVSNSWQQGGRFFRRLAGTMIGLLGVYFFVQPFFQT